MTVFLLAAAQVLIVLALAVLAVWLGERAVLWVFARADRLPGPGVAPLVPRLDPHGPASPPGQVASDGYPLSAPSSVEPPDAHVDPSGSDDQVNGVIAAGQTLRGGAWIGWLERIAVFTSIMSGYPDGVALTLAVKGLARYPELRAPSPGTAERFIIGTFVSVLVAVGCALLAQWLVGLL